jgi:hypothetical protein
MNDKSTSPSAKPTKHPLYDAEKSWKEAHKIARLIRSKAANVEKNIIAAVTETDQILDLLRELYTKTPKTDGTLFGISPIAPNRIIEHLVEQIVRTEGKDRNFSRRIKSTTVDFSTNFSFASAVDRALAWAFKQEQPELF